MFGKGNGESKLGSSSAEFSCEGDKLVVKNTDKSGKEIIRNFDNIVFYSEDDIAKISEAQGKLNNKKR